MIRSAAILMAVSAIVGPGPANAPTGQADPALPMTLRLNADGTLEARVLAVLFDSPPSDVTEHPSYLGPGPAAFPGAYVRDAMYREPFDRAELIARPYVTGGDDWLAGANTTIEDPLGLLDVPFTSLKIEPNKPAPAAPK